MSYLQIRAADVSKEKEIAIETARQERDWNFNILKFVSDHQDLIFSPDNEKRKRINDIILVTFPDKIAKALFRRLEETAGDAAKELIRLPL